MEQEILTEKLSPLKESIRITKPLDLAWHGTDSFPVNVKAVALDLTPSFNPDPITAVQGNTFSSIDGALVRHDNQKEWAIFFNDSISHAGRVNFALAHELGHYMVYRKSLAGDRFECDEQDMRDEDQGPKIIEAEANAFAANLLMPNHDFRVQTDGQSVSSDLLSHCADHNGVSLTAAVLKWHDSYQAPRRNSIVRGRLHALGEIQRQSISVWPLLRNPPRIQRSAGAFSGCPGAAFISCAMVCDTKPVSGLTKKWSTTASTRENATKKLTVLSLDDIGGCRDLDDFDEDAELLTDTYSNFINNGQKPY